MTGLRQLNSRVFNHLVSLFAGIRTVSIKKRLLCTCLLGLVVVLSRFLYWGREINVLQADEVQYFASFRESSFIQYLFIPDAGYPVPGLRLLSWVMFDLSSSPLVIHSILIAIATLCLTSPLLRTVAPPNLRETALAVSVLGVYRSPDLLLLHNLPYLLTIPVITALGRDIKISKLSTKAWCFFGIVFASKPQILVILLCVTTFGFSKCLRHRQYSVIRLLSFIGAIALSSLLLVAGRLSSSSLELSLGQDNPIGKILISPFVLVTHLFPFFTLALSGGVYLGFVDNSYIKTLIVVAIAILSLGTLVLLIYGQMRILCVVLSVTLVVPLVLFPNSGWHVWSPFSFSYFPIVHQRHNFFVLSALLFLLKPMHQRRNRGEAGAKVGSLVLVTLLIQEITIALIYQLFPQI